VKTGGAMTKSKSYDIPKRIVVEAFKVVKANKGSDGVDERTISDFEKDLKNNLYKIWNRMSSGSYFPPSVKIVEIPKKTGGTRRLGIPTVGDRIAQTVVKTYIEPKVEAIFHDDSYGYRPKKSALGAIGQARKRCWSYDYVIEFDIKGLFDNIDHELLMKAVEKHVEEKWIKLYVERWLKAPFTDKDGNNIARSRGTPQGGVISPLLANLFMHYAFDMWMKRNYPNSFFERYADDAIIHCKTEAQAKEILEQLTLRMRECKLELHQAKTKIVYCKDSNRKGKHANIKFDFLGYTFRGIYAKAKDGRQFMSFLPSVSRESEKFFRKKIKEMKIHRMTRTKIEDIAKLINPMIRGWLNYFTAYYGSKVKYTMSCLNERLFRWAKNKYKRFRSRVRLAWKWLETMAMKYPIMFAHWEKGWKP
jgi:group II intron reverse transcriptase/maturase